MNSKKNIKIVNNFIFFILLIFCTFWFIFRNQDIGKLYQIVKSANPYYLIIGIISMLFYHLTEAYNLKSLLVTLGERKISLLKALKFTFIGFFFSSITPAATGGQPIEIYYMTKEKISAPKAAISSLIMLCGYQISTISLGIICLLFNPTILGKDLIWIFLIGVTINCVALSFLLICLFSEKLTDKIINLTVKIIKFFNPKNVEKINIKLEKASIKYNEGSKFIKSHIREFFKAIMRSYIQIIFYYIVPFFVYKSLGLQSFSIIKLFAIQAILHTTVSAIPLPGAVGISEAVFLKIFESIFTTELIGASMLLTRGVTFYLFVIISLITVLINILILKNKKE